MGRDLLYAGGYARPWKDDPEEIKASRKEGDWHPATIDFKATADASGGGTAVSSLTDLLNYLGGRGNGSVEELIIIGHAASGVFALGGQIIKPQGGLSGNVKFTGGNYINDVVLSANATQIGATKVKFAEKAKIVLVGCNAGLGTTFLNQFANAFGVCVLGFSEMVLTGFLDRPGTPPKIPAAITSRGHVYVDTSGLKALGMMPDVVNWTKDVGNLKPDAKSSNCP